MLPREPATLGIERGLCDPHPGAAAAAASLLGLGGLREEAGIATFFPFFLDANESTMGFL